MDTDESCRGMTQVGAATKVINNALGTYIQVATVNKQAKSIRDDLEANALFLSSDSESVLLVSCDLAGLLPEFVANVREAMGKAAGLTPRNIIITCTHTHSGPSLLPTSYLKPVDDEYMEQLREWLVELAQEAVEVARPARIASGVGKAQIGYNRQLLLGGRYTHDARRYETRRFYRIRRA